MSKKIKITIPSSKGEQDFYVGKKTVSCALSILLLSPVIAGGALYLKSEQEKASALTLANTIEKFQSNEHKLETTISNQELDLTHKNQELAEYSNNIELLTKTNLHLNQELEDKNSQLLILGKRVYDVEKVLGITEEEPEATPDLHLSERMDAAAVNSAVRATMFRLIPNDTPLNYNRVSSSFGRRTNPISGKKHFHTGIDLTCKRGEPIYSPADGVVEIVRPSKEGFGNFMIVKHSFGFSTSYAHLKSFKVKKGQFVSKGDEIALCGNSGHSTGSHLHYETRFLGRYLNPKYLMDWTPENFEPLFEKEKKVNWASLVNLIDNVVRLQVNLTNNPHVDQPIDTASSSGVTEEKSTQ